MTRRLGFGLATFVLLVAVALLVRWSHTSGQTAAGSSTVLTAEPTATSAFLLAYARGDLAAADGLASPLYRAEWTRRGLSLADRRALLPTYLKEPGHPAVWLRFSFVGGLVDALGFGHLLCVGRATGGNARNAPTVWRVDTDRDGRVIWIEMVGLFGDSTTALTAIPPTSNPAAVPLPATANAPHPCLALGVRSSAGPEGYYAVGLGADNATVANGCPRHVTFVAVDEDGLLRPGAWTFGQAQPGLVTYGHVVPLPTVPLPTVEDNLRSAYLASLP